MESKEWKWRRWGERMGKEVGVGVADQTEGGSQE